MEIPALVRRTLGDEELEAAVNLGDEDVVCFTPTRTILYRGEGLLSDEAIEVYDHDIERLDISKGRRKTSFTLESVDATETFSVKNGRGDPVLERLLTGILGTIGVIERSEPVEGVFLFSELTIVVTETRLLKHIGSHVWDEEYEEYEYANVTGLAFEDGSVATQIVLSVSGRPQRIKIPSDDVGVLRQTLEKALFTYYDVGSLQQLNDAVATTPEQTQQQDRSSTEQSDSITLDGTISPLVGDDNERDRRDETTTTGTAQPQTTEQTQHPTGDTPDASGNQSIDTVRSARDSTDETDHEQTQSTGRATETANEVSPADIEAMQTELSELRTTVERQTELLQNQQETIEQLIEELRRRT